MPLRDPQTRIPLPSLARARPERVRDEMTRGETGEKGRRFIGITMKLRDAGVIDGRVIVTGVTDRADLRETRTASRNIVDWLDRPDIIGQRAIKCVSKRATSISAI